jgi:hypothetical protein
VIIQKKKKKKVARVLARLSSVRFAVLPCQRDFDRADV